MKKTNSILSLLLIFQLLTSAATAQVFVDLNATGANDGSSWNNAYADLSTALANVGEGSVWVAKGTYFPGSGAADTSSSFQVISSLTLYGGFAGTETSLDQRDLSVNQTILSGDLNGDDVSGDFITNRADNAHNVVMVDSMLSSCVIDGFVIQNGHTSTNNELPEFEWRGGGIFTFSPIEIRNVRFVNNFARSGAGIYFSPNGGGIGSDGSIVQHCEFTNNSTSAQAAGIYASGINDLEISNCSFQMNETNRGAVYPAFSNNVRILDCEFKTNIGINSDVFGGAIFSYQTTNFEIKRSLFEGNVASSAGAIYFDARDLTDAANFVIDSCTFINNSLTNLDGFGGVLYNWQGTGIVISHSSFSGNNAGNGAVFYHDGRDVNIAAENLIFDNCKFSNNSTNGFGGGAGYVFDGSLTMNNCTATNNTSLNGAHLFISGTNKNVEILNSTFSGGEANFGGAMALYGANSNFNLKGNTFIENTAINQGGALILGFQANATISECTFESNTADSGGAIRIQNDSTFADIVDCSFEANNSGIQGGAIYQGGGSKVSYTNSSFVGNLSAERAGALSLVTFNGDTEQGTADITNCIFNFNFASTFGAGIDIVDMPTTVTSCLFHDNLNTGAEGSGGGIYFEVTDSNSAVLNIVNTTLANNASASGSGIGLLRGAVETEMTMNLQNTLHFNLANNVSIDGGNPDIISNGGNLSSDESMVAVLTQASDLNSVAGDMFVDPGNTYDFHLVESSPAIDAGISDGAPLTDIEGTVRFGEVDSGAYEFNPNVSVKDVLDVRALSIAPNPATDRLHYTLDEALLGQTTFYIYNTQGQLMKTWTKSKGLKVLSATLNISDLPSGSYRLLARLEDKVAIKQFIKL